MIRAYAVIACVLLGACAQGDRPPPLSHGVLPPAPRLLHLRPGAAQEATESARTKVLAAARSFVAGKALVVGGYRFPTDPIGFVRAAYYSAEIDLFDAQVAEDASLSGSMVVYASAKSREQLHQHSPKPGDLLFLKMPGAKTLSYQLAIIETLEGDGSMTAMGVFKAGPQRMVMNLRQPNDAARNTTFTTPSGEMPAAALFQSFADPFAED